MINSSNTPTPLQQWLIFPEWAIGTAIGTLAAVIVGFLFFGRKEWALFLTLRMSRLFGRKGAR